MSEQEIKEGNSLIAEFMDYSLSMDAWSYEYNKGLYKSGTTIIPLSHYDWSDKLRFHYSWDWLITVVEKIESLEDPSRIVVSIEKKQCGIFFSYGHFKFGRNLESKIESTWQTIVDFIEWWNNEKKTN